MNPNSKMIERLKNEWYESFPDALAEDPSYLKPLIKMGSIRNQKFKFLGKEYICNLEEWNNDWRDFQAIKNQLAGEFCEAFELYPSESRLVDPSNYYILWCFPEIDMIKVGQLHRYVLDQNEAFAPQRKLNGD